MVLLLTGDERAAALARVREIAADLKPAITTLEDASLGSGLAGLAVFYSYLDAACPDEGHDETAAALLARAAARAAGDQMPVGLYGGFAGIAWACDHLGASDGDHDPNRRIDELVAATLREPADDQHYDLLNGLVGLGLYGLDRGDRGGGAAILARVVELLEAWSTTRDDGITWHTPDRLLIRWQRKMYPDGYYNLGMAHGIPGIIGLLARATHAGACKPALLDGALRWLGAQAQPGHDAAYGSCMTDDEREVPTRSAWCYGDPGIALAFVAGGLAFDRGDRWRELGVELARGVCRRSREGCHVVDAGLCHGTAGLGHMLNRIYQSTGDAEVGEAARRWFRETLAIRISGGYGGYAEASSEMEGPTTTWDNTPGILTGAAGVGLALLAAASDTPPDWDRMLLADLSGSPPAT